MSGNEDTFQKAMNEGHSAAWDQQWDKAVEAYRNALQASPDHPSALSNLGLALYQLARFEDALHAYQRLGEISPNDPIPFEKTAELSERLGQLKPAIDASMHAADLYLQSRDADKAIENWARVTQLDPEHIPAHSRMAMVHERLGHPHQAVIEYLAVAAMIQRSGNMEKTTELVNKAQQLMPNSPEVKQAISLLRTNQNLPKPVRPKGGTGPIRMALVKQLEVPPPTQSGLDPIAEARQKALTKLAGILFDYTDENNAAQTRRGMQAIMRGTGQLALQQADSTKVVMHLGQAIDSQTKNQEAQAITELELALEAGFTHPSLYFDLGLLHSKGDKLESALQYLQNAVKHRDYALGARLVIGQILQKMGRVSDAAIEYLEALKLADSAVLPPEQADELRQLYEPLIEAQASQRDEATQARLCENISALLNRPNWHDQLLKAREELPQPQEGELPVALAEVLIQAESSQVIEAINHVHQLARAGFVRTALDEAYYALNHAPSYLPLHILIGDLMAKEDRSQEAITKYTVVARSYSVRGESAQAINMLRRVIQISPMDMAARTGLIEQLIARGQTNEAISEYLDLAEIYYRLAELDNARKTYTTALRLSQQSNADRAWNVHILQHMADIDMQRLDWKQAMRIYEQIRTLRPDDESVRKSLIELNIRMGQLQQALAELENFLAYQESNGKGAIHLLEELIKEHENQAFLHRALAEQYRRADRVQDAINQLEAAGELLLDANNKAGAAVMVAQIIALNPPNAEEYRQLLSKLQSAA